MADIQLGCHTVRSHGAKLARLHMYDWIILLLLAVLDGLLNIIEPFHRFVGRDMMTDLSYPLKGNTIPFWAVPLFAILLPGSSLLEFTSERKMSMIYTMASLVFVILYVYICKGTTLVHAEL
ncbi:hypothetical protein ACQ4PT_013473 [Festuca glaucescens]